MAMGGGTATVTGGGTVTTTGGGTVTTTGGGTVMVMGGGILMLICAFEATGMANAASADKSRMTDRKRRMLSPPSLAFVPMVQTPS
jgi:hypothetical protein